MFEEVEVCDGVFIETKRDRTEEPPLES